MRHIDATEDAASGGVTPVRRPGLLLGQAPGRALLGGALAGIVGGLVFGAAMTQTGALPTIASLVRADSSAAGFAVHMAIAATVGAGFGLLVWRQQPGAGETLFWGLTYGALWWFIGPLTLLPLFLGEPLAWTLDAAQAEFSALPGHLLYGTATGLTLAAFGGRLGLGTGIRVSRGALVRGALAGIVAAWLLAATLDRKNELVATSAAMSDRSAGVAWLGVLTIGLVAGLGYGLLYPHIADSAGASLVRGVAYGFLAWVLASQTILPLLDGNGLAWSVLEARAGFPTLPGYLLFGAILALVYHWLEALHRVLLSDDVRRHEREGVGVQGLRALGRGALAGLVGGLAFTLIMLQIDYLPTVAALVGSDSALTGFLIHLVIADLIGASYGVLFRRQSYDLGSALGWGVAYGFCWWILGALTLLPVLLGGAPQWSATGAAYAFPALIGHLVYGASLGVMYHLLESRYNPWWVSRSEAEAARRDRHREQVLTSAPALWTLVLVIALTVPILLGQP